MGSGREPGLEDLQSQFLSWDVVLQANRVLRRGVAHRDLQVSKLTPPVGGGGHLKSRELLITWLFRSSVMEKQPDFQQQREGHWSGGSEEGWGD